MASVMLENRRGRQLASLWQEEAGFCQRTQATVARTRPRLRTVDIRPLAAEDRREVIRFARALPGDDLLCLERDIADPAEVDAWIKDTVEGRVVTFLAWNGDVVVGYASFQRGSVPWIRHVAELRVAVAETARGFGIGRRLLEMAFETALDVGVMEVIAHMNRNKAVR